MIILFSGMQRSASTWSYNAVRQILAHGGIPVSPASGIFDELEGTDAAVARGAPERQALLIKCHFPGPGTVGAIDCQRVWNIFTYRDPRGATASMMVRFNSSFRNAAREVHRSLLLSDIYRAGGGTLFVGHDGVVARPEAEIARIAAYLKLPIDDSDAKRIADSLQREKLAGRVSAVDRDAMREYRRIRHDPETLVTEHHFKGDGISDWRRILGPLQRDILNHLWARWLSDMGEEARRRWWLAPVRVLYERYRLFPHRIEPFEPITGLP